MCIIYIDLRIIRSATYRNFSFKAIPNLGIHFVDKLCTVYRQYPDYKTYKLCFVTLKSKNLNFLKVAEIKCLYYQHYACIKAEIHK